MSGRDIYQEYATPVPESVLAGLDDPGTTDQGTADQGNTDNGDAGANDNIGQQGSGALGDGGNDDAGASSAGSPGQDGEGGGSRDDQDDDRDTRSPTIPRSRFDQVHRQLQQYKDEAEELRAKVAELKSSGGGDEGGSAKQNEGGQGAGNTGTSTVPVDINALEKDYIEAFDLGDTALALDIRGQINAELERRAEDRVAKSFEKREAAKEAQKLADSLRDAALDVVKTYPILNTDKTLVDEVFALRNVLAHQRNIPLDQALRRAAEILCSGKAAPAQSGTATNQGGDRRLKDTLGRNLHESQQQPHSIEGASTRSSAGEIRKPGSIPQAEWDAMPEEKRNELLA
jgi:hypothetical protein